MMPIRQRAAMQVVFVEILAQPLPLRRARRIRDVAVERDDVPVAEVVAVEAEAERSGRRPEVRVIRAGATRHVIVIAWSGPRPVAVASPPRLIAVREPRRRSIHVPGIS